MKRYYLVSILGRALEPLTYSFADEIKKNSVVQVPLGKKHVVGVVLRECEKPEFTCKDIAFLSTSFFSKTYFDVAKFISNYYIDHLGKSLSLFTPFYSEKRLKKQNFSSKVVLSKEQNRALEFINNNRVSLLFGDTGSGKTEIYIKAIEECLNENKTALFLMPEISLTPQIEKRLKEHFGDTLGIWHSKISKPKKEKILQKIDSGEIRVVAGARSSLFLPMKNLGVIVVDEEHDDSYKSEQSPRYSARDLAVYIGDKLKLKVVLGSATPAMTSYHKFPTFRLKGQYFEGRRDFIFKKSEETILDGDGLFQIEDTLKRGKQTIVFVPTRANYKNLVCKECGAKVECPYCNVSLSLHSKRNILRCHYCGYASAIKHKCDECGSEMIEAKRVGTAEVVKFLQEQFPKANIEQFDRDTITTDSKLKRSLNAFNNGEIDILVGTQMLSKGHNYHSVECAIVIGIDYMLHSSDFRAEEKALSLLMQIGGRAGRKSEGKVLVYSNNYNFFSRYLEDYEKFLKEYLPMRRDLYPPFKKLARVVFEDKNRGKAEDAMNDMVSKLLAYKEKVELVGFGECQIGRINNKFRYNILLRGDSPKDLINTLYVTKNPLGAIDIDPLVFT